MRAWCYHCPVPPEHSRIHYHDVKMDQSEFPYERMLTHWARAAVRYGAKEFIYRGHKDTDRTAPMHQRVVAMLEEVTHALDEPIAFLDSDAFLNQNIAHLFDGDFDVAVTYRHNMAMRLNEGCILVNSRNPDRVRSFFQAYLDTYNRLCTDPAVVAEYGDIRRWRGGQLSLNTIANPLGVPTSLDRLECAGATVVYLPCFKYNFSVDRVDPTELDTKAVLHMKGARKHLLDDIVKYQENKRA